MGNDISSGPAKSIIVSRQSGLNYLQTTKKITGSLKHMIQGRRKIWNSGGATRNVVGIICPSWLRYVVLNDFCKACDLITKVHKLPIKVINDIKIDCLEFLCENFAYQ